VDRRRTSYAGGVGGRDEGYVENAHVVGSATARGNGPAGAPSRGRVSICQDIATDPRMAPWREAALARGFRSLLGLPLKTGGQVIGR